MNAWPRKVFNVVHLTFCNVIDGLLHDMFIVVVSVAYATKPKDQPPKSLIVVY